MKMARLAATLILTSLSSFSASAGCVGTVVMGECSGTEIDHVNEYESGYESSSGTRYEYDLNGPSDRNRYSIDQDAQRRDQMSLDPSRQLDRGIGNNGGGIYD